MLQLIRRKTSLPAALLFTAFGFFACEGSPTSDLPNVILIVMDTARAENFSCYGYHRPTSPNIDSLAHEATFYCRAIASSPWTVPTHASMFTGKESFEHGAHRLPPGKKKKASRLKSNPLHKQHTTLAEVLAAENYATGAIVANSVYINERYQMDQGFQTFYAKHAVSDSINKWVYAWLDTLSTSPFFLFINYMDTHTPYNMKTRPGLLEEPVRHDRGQLETQLRARIMRSGGGTGAAGRLKQLVIDQYDTAIANLDEQIGKLIAFLQEKGLHDRGTPVGIARTRSLSGAFMGASYHQSARPNRAPKNRRFDFDFGYPPRRSVAFARGTDTRVSH
jgi:arylsulfatase A-like enzyme